jgi:NAD(P)-dependent dehydrogenase (short-subunit alcohol dehydrogenase family)
MGLGLCQNLTSKGAKVVGCDMNESVGTEKMKELVSVHCTLSRAASTRLLKGATFVKGDVTNWSSIQNVFTTAVKEHGTVDLCFPNAGVSSLVHPFHPVSRWCPGRYGRLPSAEGGQGPV